MGENPALSPQEIEMIVSQRAQVSAPQSPVLTPEFLVWLTS